VVKTTDGWKSRSATFSVNHKGDLVATTGKIAGWSIGTSKAGYQNCISRASKADSNGAEYEIALVAREGTPKATNAAFYIKKKPKGKTWNNDNLETLF
jgi:hypothetical protein